MLALTAALSATCFVKAFGVAFLGQPRSSSIPQKGKVSFGMGMAQAFLALFCLIFGILPTTVIDIVNIIPNHLFGYGLPHTQGWLWLTPLAEDIASYSAPFVLMAIITVWGLVYLLLHPSKKTRRTPPWECGFGGVTPRMQYTSTAFAMPIRRIFKPIWRIEEIIKEQKDNKTLYSKTINHELYLADRFWPVLYEPFINGMAYVARQIGRIQTGHIRTYLAYSFFTLLVLLWLIT
jgi:hypothetical protein